MPNPTPGKLETDDESQQKKILSQEKKNTHQQTKILIQRKHVYAYDMPFLCPPNLCAILINRGITIIIPQYMNLFLQEKLILTKILFQRKHVYAYDTPFFSALTLVLFIKWGDKHNFSPLHDLLPSTKKHFLYAL